jgi:cold shock CspA family protein
MTSTQVSETESTSFVGQVKWFNNRLGYGFITIVSPGDHNGEDIFVHQQHITPKTSDYRSLQQGEYVSFQLGTADANSDAAASENAGGKHVNQAVKVTGVFGGALMCDQIPRRVPAGARRPQQSTPATPAAAPAQAPTTPRRGAPAGRGRGRPRTTRND